ncbi:MAG TPA: ABC transporter permease subunit [Acidimicrobiales bacterium]|jgi:ABC-type transport system involved in multi-copper enzyme maturation permease subunit|nr:ABC transporter permease subunit [Acidimicrobiales bacterium]
MSGPSPEPAPYRSQQVGGHNGFAQLLWAEWTKFRTVRAWKIGIAVSAGMILLFGVLIGGGSHTSEQAAPGPGPTKAVVNAVPLGPGGEAVSDNFYFVDQPVGATASITVRITSLTELIPTVPSAANASGPDMVPGTEAWTKAGVIIKASTTQGSAYAAVMVTPDHGVRMQYDFTHDLAGLQGTVSASSPRWLRLSRSGATVTGYDSLDGIHWIEIGATRLPGLPSTSPGGLFVASPHYTKVSTHFGGETGFGAPTSATATLDHATVLGGDGGSWTAGFVGDDPGGSPGPSDGSYQVNGGRYTVTGSGDIAPLVNGPLQQGQPVERSLAGAFAGLIAIIVVAVVFMTAEYRKGLIRTTLAASPRRGRVLLAKATVVATVAFVAGTIGAGVTLPLGEHLFKANGFFVFPVGTATEVRIIVGTGLVLAVSAVFALAVGSLFSRSAGAVTTGIVLLVLPYVLGTAQVLPTAFAQWILRITPAAAFAIQQSLPVYHQVTNSYTPANGYFPLAPWVGLAVLGVYSAVALGLAVVSLQRRDA